MTFGDVFFVAVTLLFVGGAAGLAAKLYRMLFRDGSYWVGGSPWYVDKRAAPGEHAFYVGVFSIALVISLCLAALFLFAVVTTYF